MYTHMRVVYAGVLFAAGIGRPTLKPNDKSRGLYASPPATDTSECAREDTRG